MADKDKDKGKDAKGDEEQDIDQESIDALKKKITDAQKREEKSLHKNYQDEIEDLRQASQESKDQMVRAFAELKNAQRRMEEEKNAFAAFAAQSLVLQVLDIYDNYHRLMEHKPDGLPEDEWHKGLDMIDAQFGKFLEQQGVTVIEVKVGDKIDPERHEAMMTDKGPEGEILEVFSKGYEMKGRVIKTAKVKVGKGKK